MKPTHFRHLPHLWRVVVYAACCLVSCFVNPAVVFAAPTSDPYAEVFIEHDSNVYRVQNSAALAEVSGDPTLGDTDTRAIVGYDGSKSWGLQTLSGNIQARKVYYDHFTDLDHYEYLGLLTFAYKLASDFDGQLQFQQQRASASFADKDSPFLAINTDRLIAGTLNFNVTPDWRIESGINFHHLAAPLEGYPDYENNEVTSTLGFRYVGVANLSYGMTLTRTQGSFDHAAGADPYSQDTAQFRLNYTVSTLTLLNAAIGYTRRDESGEGSVGAFTGALGYTRQLTGKTSLVVQFARSINNYVAAGGSEVDLSATAGVNWQASYRWAVAVNYGYTRSSFKGQAGLDALEANRVDRSPFESASVSYKIARRLDLRAYLNKSSRTSTIGPYNFSDTIYGLDISSHWK